MRDTCNSCIKQMNKQQKIIRKNNNLNCIFSIGLMIIKYDPMWSLLSQAEFSSSARVQFSDFRYDFVFFFCFVFSSFFSFFFHYQITFCLFGTMDSGFRTIQISNVAILAYFFFYFLFTLSCCYYLFVSECFQK